MTDFSLWEVFKNGNKVLKRTVKTVKQIYEPTFIKEKLDKKNEMKAKGTLLMALPNKDQLKFHSYKDAKLHIKAIEKIALKNQEKRGREYGRKTVPLKNPTENALIAQDRIGGYDWSYQVEEEHLTNYALMALTSSGSSSSLDFEIDSYSRTCIKAYATLKEQYDSLSSDYKKSQFNLVSYKAAENTKKLEKAEKERDELKLTLEKFQNSSKSLNNFIDNQVSDKVKTVLGYQAASLAVKSFVNSSEMLENQENVKSRSDKGYHAVPPPYTGNYIPPKPDLMFIDE
nr:hypothetical protein [Tanacetum cinerariifolium]